MLRRLLLGLLLSLLVCQSAAPAVTRVVLRSDRDKDYVPVHKKPKCTRVCERVPNGTEGTVMERLEDGKWLMVRLDDGRSPWVSSRYVHYPPTVWRSREICERIFSQGGRLARDDEPALRIGTWNIEWFPKGCSSTEFCPEKSTNVPWLACTIAWMDVDLLAVQEFTRTEEGRRAATELLERLDGLTGGRWQLKLQDCGEEDDQRVGFLWRDDRVRLSDHVDLWQLNGKANRAEETCKGRLRPGRHAGVKSTREDGAAFAVLTLHLDAGWAERDYSHRRIAQGRIASLSVAGEPLLKDAGDIVILGDFNVGGWGEMELLDRELSPSYQRMPIETANGQRAPHDLIVVSSSMADGLPSAVSLGACRKRPQQRRGTFDCAAHRRLSDHQPVLIDVPDRRRPR